MFKLSYIQLIKVIILTLFLSTSSQTIAQKVRVIDNKGTLRYLNRVTVADTPHADPVAGDIWFDTNPTGSEPVPTGYNKAYEVKIYDSTGSWRRLVDNIYNKSSYLTSPRKVNGKGNSLTFENINQYNLNARKIDFNSYIKSITLNPIGYNNTTHPYYDPTSYGIIANGPFWGKKAYRDSDGDTGTNNQVLSSVEIGIAPNTERGTNWVNASSLIKGTPGSVFFANTDGTVTEDNDHFFWDKTNERLYIGAKLSGTNKLNVAGTTRTQGVSNSDGSANRPSYRFTGDSNTGMFRGTSADHLRFTTGGQEAVTINNSQNVGIGITTPSEKLDINGKLRIRDVEDITTTGLSVGDKIVIVDANGVVKKISGSFHTVGDIKYSVKTTNHNGWYLLNGQTVNGVAGTNATNLGISSTLPDATDKVLKHPRSGENIFDDYNIATTTLSRNNLPSLVGETTSDGSHSHNVEFGEGVGFSSEGITGWGSRRDLRNQSTIGSGSHNHTVIVNKNSPNIPISNYQPYLVVNTFIYLGQ